MTNWSKEDEQKYYEAQVRFAKQDHDNHNKICNLCGQIVRCERGDYLEGLLAAAQENLRKVYLKNRLY